MEQLKRNQLASSNPLIWPIFLCHVAQPQSIPVYDVNVWIAWGWIVNWVKPEHYRQQPKKLSTYLEFRTWFNGLVATGKVSPRELTSRLDGLWTIPAQPMGSAVPLGPGT